MCYQQKKLIIDMVYFVGRLIGWPMVEPPKKTSPLWSHWFIYIIIELEKALRSCSEFLPRRSTWQQRPIATIWLTIWHFFCCRHFGNEKMRFHPFSHVVTPGSWREKNPGRLPQVTCIHRFSEATLTLTHRLEGVGIPRENTHMKPWWKPSYHGNPKPSFLEL